MNEHICKVRYYAKLRSSKKKAQIRHRKWTAKESFKLLWQVLKNAVYEYGISQEQYYKWRDVLLNDGIKLFERDDID